jgi:small subunit ribosomal protein S16
VRFVAVKIRLRRIGGKKKPFYRIVVADSRSPRDGKFIETIGHYNPRTRDPIVLDLAKVEEWQKKGAQPTETVGKLIKKLRKQLEKEKETEEKKETKKKETEKEE